VDYAIADTALAERIEKAVARALPLIRSSFAERQAIERSLAGEAVEAVELDDATLPADTVSID
jgi:hypothetical protein